MYRRALLGSVIRQYGHTVKMMAPQFVKPYVMSNKNDRIVWAMMATGECYRKEEAHAA